MSPQVGREIRAPSPIAGTFYYLTGSHSAPPSLPGSLPPLPKPRGCLCSSTFVLRRSSCAVGTVPVEREYIGLSVVVEGS